MNAAIGTTVFNDLNKLDDYLRGLTLGKMAESGVGYAQAYKLICSENPNLMELRGQLVLRSRQQPVSERSECVLPAWSPLEDLGKLDEYLGRLASERSRASKLGYGQALKLVAARNPELLALREGLLQRRKDEERGVCRLSEKSREALCGVDAELREHWDRVWNANRFVSSDEMVRILLSDSPRVMRLCRLKGDLLRGIDRQS